MSSKTALEITELTNRYRQLNRLLDTAYVGILSDEPPWLARLRNILNERRAVIQDLELKGITNVV